jgi:hypothetical protein
MVSMAQPVTPYDAVALIKQVYAKIKPSLGFLQIDDGTGFITLKDPNPPLDKLPSGSDLNEQITQLENAIKEITSETIKPAINSKDEELTTYAAHAYVLNCLLHVQTILNERKFRAIYMETIKAAQKAGAAPFY